MWSWTFLVICAFVIKTQAAPVGKDPYAEDMKNRKQIAIECMSEVKINRTIIEKAMFNINQLPPENEYKEFLTCSYKKQNFQSEDGVMLFDNIKNFLSRFYDRGDLKVLDKCATIKSEDSKDIAYDSLKCILKNLQEIDITTKNITKDNNR